MSQAPNDQSIKKDGVPEGLWMRCSECGAMLFRKVVEEALHVCPECQNHFRVSARTRVEQLVDPGSFEEMYQDLEPADPLKFVDRNPTKNASKPCRPNPAKKTPSSAAKLSSRVVPSCSPPWTPRS